MVSPSQRAQARYQTQTQFTEMITAGSYEETVDDDLNTVRTIVATHYTGLAQVKYPTLTVSDKAALGQQMVEQSVIVKVPSGSVRIPEGDMVIVTASTADALLVDREFRVEGSPQSGETTSHRYPVKELS